MYTLSYHCNESNATEKLKSPRNCIADLLLTAQIKSPEELKINQLTLKENHSNLLI